MKDAGRTALKVGLAGAAILFVIYVAMSVVANNSLYDDSNKSNESYVRPATHTGLFWLAWIITYFGIINVTILISGLASTLAAYPGTWTKKEALAVRAIACTTEICVLIVAVAIYQMTLSAFNQLPYFRDIHAFPITPLTIFLILTIIICLIISVIFENLLLVARNILARKPAGQ